MKTNGPSGKRKPRFGSILLPFSLSAAALISLLMLHAAGSTIYPGDLNVDRHLDVSDAVLLARLCCEDDLLHLTSEGLMNADVNGDTKVNGNDTTMLLRQIAKQLPMPPYPFETTVPVTETTTESETTTTETTTVTTTTVTTTVTTVTTAETVPVETEPVQQDLTADKKPYPLGVSISVLTGQTQPNEMLTVAYDIGNIIFAIFANDPADTTIAIAFEDNIVGYYKICSEYTAPAGYTVREYRDEFYREEGDLYAVSVLRSDVSIRFDHLADRNDFEVLSKLNYYAVSGLRAIMGLPGFKWHPELAKIARAHSVDMADHNMFEHHSSDGTSRKDRMLNAGIDYMTGGENISRGQFDTFDAVDGWLGSDQHRMNMLSEKFTHIGVGFAYNESADGYFYGTQDFCSFFPE